MAIHGTITQFVPGEEDWTAYVERLNYYFIANEVTGVAKKRSILLSACGPKTYKLIRSLVPADKIDETAYDELVKLVQQYYDPKPSKIVQRYKFNTRARRDGESVATYVASLRELAEHCGYGETLQEMLRDRLVCGVRHVGIQKRLLAEKDLTYEKAYELALTMEAAERDTKDLKHDSGRTEVHKGEVHSIQSRRGRKDSSRKRGKPTCYRCGGEHLAPSCRFKETECHRCKKVGHIAKMCKTKTAGGKCVQQTHHVQVKEENEPTTYSLFTVHSELQDAMTVELTMNGIPVTLELDTGAALTLINRETYHRIATSSQPLEKTKVKLKTYTGETIELLGAANFKVVYSGIEEELLTYVVDGEGPNLMGRDWINKFKVSLKGIYNLVGTGDSALEKVLSKHAVVFSKKLGTLKGYKAKLYVDPEAKPKFFKPRTVPFAMKPLVETELNRLESEGTISPVQFSKWAAPIVPVMKQNGTVRVCGDYKVTINQALQIDSYPLPRVEELFASLAGGKHFTKLDMSQAYLQLELEEESKPYVTVNTHKGLFQYNRLPFGVSTAPAIFQRCMENLFQGCKGVCVYLDDILVTGSNTAEHLRNLDKVLERVAAAGISLNRTKCSFMLSKVEYLGHMIDENGLHPTEEKVKAIKEVPSPKNVTELRAFLGIINYYGKFLPNLSTQLAPLHVLLQKKQRWYWSTTQEMAFQAAKNTLQANSLLVHYDGLKPLILACDASPYGVGAVLSHIMPDGAERPVAYASRTLTPAEKNYSQLEKEGLAVVYGVKKFHNYLWGRHFSIESDHQPLLHLFGESREIPPLASSRIQRWALTLSAYHYSIRYKAGKALGNADALSRLLRPITTSSDCLPGDLIHLVKHLSATAINTMNIKHWTDKDPILSRIKQCLRQGWPSSKLGDDFKPYQTRWKELSLLDGCVLWGARVIVPPPGRKLVLEELHETHPGVSKMKALARSYVWWPHMDKEIEEVVRTCENCQANRPSPPVAQLHPWEWPEQPWSRIHLDFAGPFMNHMFLVLVDAHSKWLDVQVMQSITTAKTIDKLNKLFSTHGLPQKIVTDNGPSFTSDEFKRYMQANGIKHITSAPYHPATNGLAERAVQTMKQGIRQMQNGSIEEKLAKFLFKYRITPHSTTGVSPSELLMGHRIRSRLDLLLPDLTSVVQDKQLKQKQAHDKKKPDRNFIIGATVFAEDFTASSEKWLPGVVQKVTGPLSYQIELSNGQIVRRHVDSIRARVVSNDQVIQKPQQGILSGN